MSERSALRRLMAGRVAAWVRIASAFAFLLTAVSTTLLGPSDQAVAACVPAAAAGLNPPPGTTVICTGTTTNANGTNGYGTGDQDGLTINVVSGATVTGDDNGIFVNNNNVINNAGTITGTQIGASGINIFAGGAATITNTGGIVSDGQFGNGIFVDVGATVTVNNLGSIQANGDTGTGINIDGTAIVTNSGTIIANGANGVAVFVCNCGNLTLTNSGLIQADGNNGVAIQVGPGGTGNIVNTGTITANGPGGVGILGDVGSTLSVTNAGTITASNFGIFASDNAVILNSGSITVTQPSGTVINVGSNAALPGTPNIVNTGTLTAGDDSTGIVAGSNNFIVNAGTIVTGNSTGFGFQSGILADAGSMIVNSGTIKVGDGTFSIDMIGILAVGDGVTIQNSGLITTGISAAGIATLGNNTQITNSGTIIANGSTGILISAFGAPTTGTVINNSGTIIANTLNGTGGIGVNFQDNSGTLNNTGLIRALGNGSVAINTCAPACGFTTTVINAGIVDGQVFLDNGATITNSGLMTITATDAEMAVGVAHITGDAFVQTASGTLALRVTGDGRNDALGTAAGGTVTLAGTFRALVQPGLYANNTTYINVVTSGSNITTQFDNVTSSSPFFAASGVYNLQSVDLNLSRIPFGSVPGLTPNQRAVGNALEGSYSAGLTGNAATLYGNVLAATSVTVLDSLSGESLSATQNAAFTAGSLFNSAMQTQGLFAPDLGGLSIVIPPAQYAATRAAPGHEAFASLNKAPVRTQQPGSFRIWTAGFGGTQSLRGEADTGSFSQSVRSAGGMLGFDWLAAPDFRIGAAAGGSESTFSVANLATHGRVTGGHIGAYAMKTWGAYYAAASLSYARFDNSTTRTIAGIGPTETASGRFSSDQLSARLELGWKQVYGRINVTPFVAVEPAVLWQRGFTEIGANVLGLNVASHTTTALPTFVGVQVDGRYLTPEGAMFAPYSRLSWVHEFEPNRRVTSAFVALPGPTFTVDGARAASDAARLDTGAKLMFHGGQTVFANFAGEWSDRTESYAATGGFRYAW